MELINITYKNKTDFALEPLTAERFRELWSRTYNTEGKPDWSHIFPSGSSTTAKIEITNLNTADGGNDFALDDLALPMLATVLHRPAQLPARPPLHRPLPRLPI